MVFIFFYHLRGKLSNGFIHLLLGKRLLRHFYGKCLNKGFGAVFSLAATTTETTTTAVGRKGEAFGICFDEV